MQLQCNNVLSHTKAAFKTADKHHAGLIEHGALKADTFCIICLETCMHDTSDRGLMGSSLLLQASGLGLFYIRVDVKALVTGSITKWSPNSTS
jgi:hypothetical protein